MLGAWSADRAEGEHYRLTVTDAQRDPIGWDNHDPAKLIAELTLRTADWRGRAAIISADPLVVDIWRDGV